LTISAAVFIRPPPRFSTAVYSDECKAKLKTGFELDAIWGTVKEVLGSHSIVLTQIEFDVVYQDYSQQEEILIVGAEPPELLHRDSEITRAHLESLIGQKVRVDVHPRNANGRLAGTLTVEGEDGHV